MGPKKKQMVRFVCGSRSWEMSVSVATVNSPVLRDYYDDDPVGASAA